MGKYSISPNNVIEVVKQHSQIPTSYNQIIDLGQNENYHTLGIYSNLDQDIKIKFKSQDESIPDRVVTIFSSVDYVFDVISLRGSIEIANLTGASLTAGRIQLLFW